MSEVLIAGASGPLGRAVHAALEGSHSVHRLSRTGHDGTLVADIRNPRATRPLLEAIAPDTVILLARSEPEAHSDASIDTAVGALTEFASWCHLAGATRLLFASSAAVYGTSGVAAFAEDAPTPAPGAYAQAKLRAERALASIGTSTGMAVVSFRIFNVYGPGFELSLVNRLRAAAEGARAPEIFETDQFVRDYVHGDDVAAAFATATSMSELDSAILNVGTGRGISNLELLSLIPGARWEPAGELDAPSVCVADVSALRVALGTAPRSRFAEVR